MASIVAYIELREGDITPPSLFAVTESRRLADAAGATVYAFLPIGAVAHEVIDGLAEKLSAAGVDRILCSAGDALAGPALDPTHGPVLAQMVEQLRPLLILFPAGGCGAQLGPPLAIRIGAAYVPDATLEVHPLDGPAQGASQRVLVTRWRAAHDGVRRIDVGDLERPVVAVLLADRPHAFLGGSHGEVQMFPCPTANPAEVHLLTAHPDTAADLDSCATLVCAAADALADLEVLRAQLPVDACALADTDSRLGRAAPAVFLGLSIEAARLPIRAGTVGLVSASPAELAVAVRRLREGHSESQA